MQARETEILYHSVSLSLFVNQFHSMDIKLVTVFILLEYSEYFRAILPKFEKVTFEQFVLKTAKLAEWGGASKRFES